MNKVKWFGVAFLLLIFGVLSYSAVLDKGLTNDEIAHITAGYTYLKTVDFRLNPEHPPLIKILAAVPLLFLNPNLPLNDPSWLQSKEWLFAQIFFFTANTNADQILAFARFPMVLVAMLLGFYIFRWALEWYGEKSAFLALFLFTFSPSFLGHGPLVTTDVGVTAFIFISCYYFFHFCEHQNKKLLVKSGVSAGFALASKFTGIYLIPVFYVQGCWYQIKHHGWESLRGGKSLSRAVLIACVFIVGFGVLILSYGVVGFLSYFVGFLRVALHSSWGHRAFLLGNYSENGWWYYFFVAFLVKEPIAFILMIVLTCVLWKKLKGEWLPYREGFVLIPIILFFLAATLNKLNIGVRHIFPIYPFLFLLCSDVVNVKIKNSVKYGIVAFLGVWYVVASVGIYPDYIAYFNEAVGPVHASDVLIDSNIDWGQDLKPLSDWLQDHGNPHVQMAYFGTDSRSYRHIDWEELKCGPRSGLIVASVNHINGFTYNNSLCSGWLKKETPIAIIGYSIFIYNLSDRDIITPREDYCQMRCEEKCVGVGTHYKVSFWNMSKNSCHCSCK